MRFETYKRLTTTVVIFLSLYGIIKFYDANVRPVVLKIALNTFSASSEEDGRYMQQHHKEMHPLCQKSVCFYEEMVVIIRLCQIETDVFLLPLWLMLFRQR